MRRIAPLLLASALVLAACSSGGSDAGQDSTTTKPKGSASTTTGAGGGETAGGGHACDQGAAFDEVPVEPVAGVDSDRTMTSPVDGTGIRLHWFPVAGASADDPAPTILMGPGWSLPGDTSIDGDALFSALTIGSMRKDGYNVLTWDPRGFGKSGGTATVNDPGKEGQDVRAMLDFVASQPGAQTDGEGDPRAGMVGFSYGGGIQLTTASIDCRVDAIVPGIAWNSLQTSLYKADTVKTGWAKVLTSAVDPDRLDPHINSASASGLRDGTLSDEDRDWFVSRGPGDDAIAKIDIPTLFVQGTVDTLFSLDEATTNYGILRKDDVPTAMLWFCGGHGTCLTDPGDRGRVAAASFAWLDHYLKGEDTDLPAGVDLVDQDGRRWTAEDWPVAEGEPLTGTGSGTLALKAEGGSGGDPTALDLDPDDPLGGVVASITPTQADNAVDVAIDAGDADVLALGAPKLTITYSGDWTGDVQGAEGRVFAQLVDDETGLVLGNQITPIQVTVDGTTHTAESDLEIIAHHVTPGHGITLQIVAATSAYGIPVKQGTIDFDSIEISVPTAAPKAVAQG
ncbi:MAG TPA: CocE/NonD family hydrolase [Acidimicrobiales bacterium]|nr:CocE/NonD family hydrolase [Acidimicrobiales bacterium]